MVGYCYPMMLINSLMRTDRYILQEDGFKQESSDLSKESSDPWSGVNLSRETRQLFQQAIFINEYSKPVTHFKITFASLLLSFLISADNVSRWFEVYVRVNRNNIPREKLLKHKQLNSDKLKEIRNQSASQELVDKPEPVTQTTENLLKEAIELLQFTSSKEEKILDVRHIMGSYIYSRLDEFHEKRLVEWQLMVENWSNSFLTMLNEQYSDEIDSWKIKHKDRFGKDPVLEPVPSARIATDQWTLKDTLRFSYYAHAIARFLTHNQTKPPLCISIQAPWGGGKTSLMRMIQYKLDPEALKTYLESADSKSEKSKDQSKPEEKAKIKDLKDNLEKQEIPKIDEEQIEHHEKYVEKRLTVWFNAWKYQNTEQIWAGLADAIVQQVADRLQPKEKQLFLFQLHKRRYGADRISQRINDYVKSLAAQKSRPWWTASIVGVVGSALLATIESISASSAFALVGISGIFIAAGLGIGQTLIRRYLVESKTDADESVEEYVSVPDYSKNLGFIHDAVEDLNMVFQTIPEKLKKLVIFIDDLDRCSPDKVAHVIEAVNLFLAGEFQNCMFVMGVDPEIVAASLEEAHHRIIDKLPKFASDTPVGWRFMDKFVQLPVIIPPPEKDDIEWYVENLLSNEEKQERRASEVVDKFEQLSKPTPDDKVQEVIKQEDTKVQKLINRERDERIRIKNLDRDVTNYNEDDPKIRQLISMAASEFFSDNPREVKRFINVFRFQYFLLLARRNGGLNVPSERQLTRWIILSMRWPELARWIQGRHSRINYEGMALESDKPVHRRLAELESIAAESSLHKGISDKIWKEKIGLLLDLHAEQSPWITDAYLRAFFENELIIERPAERLSGSTRNGFY